MDYLEKKAKEEKKAMDEDIENFRQEFYSKYKVQVLVSYRLKNTNPIQLSLKQIEELLIEDAKMYNPQVLEDYASFLKDKGRTREIVLYKQFYCLLGRQAGYTLLQIAKSIGYNHATIIHGSRSIDNLLKIRDREVTEIFNRLMYEIQQRSSNDGNV